MTEEKKDKFITSKRVADYARQYDAEQNRQDSEATATAPDHFRAIGQDTMADALERRSKQFGVTTADRAEFEREKNNLERILYGAGQQAKDLFLKNVECWVVSYRGGTNQVVPNTIGMRYIHYLLGHPGKPLSSKELIDAVQPELSLPDLSEERGVLTPEGGTKEQPTGNIGVTIRGKDMEDRPDVASDVAIRKAEKDLQEDLDKIDSHPDLTIEEREEERGRVEAKLELFKDYRRQHRGTGKKPRQYSDMNRERRRHVVKNNITRARDQFKEIDPLLYAHLKAAIYQQEGLWAYKPSGEYIPEWITQ